MTVAVLKITPVSTEEVELWRLAEEVAAIFEGLPWVLIGGVMVRIIEAEHGVEPAFATGDLDAVLDLRTLTTATRVAADRLQEAGFEPERHDESVTYRFTRGGDTVDVLAPDNGRRDPGNPPEADRACGSRNGTLLAPRPIPHGCHRRQGSGGDEGPRRS